MLRKRSTLLSTRLFRQVLALLASACMMYSANAQADDDNLIQQVHQFLYQETQALGEEVAIDLRPPSPHLPNCINPEPFLPNANQAPLGRVSVGVRCGDGSRQVRYLQAQVDVIGNYVVAARDIERGTLITSEMLNERGGNLGELSAQALTSEEDIIGKIAQRPIRSGDAFLSHYLQAPHLVERGQRVTVIAQGAAFRVSREGEALENGALGERIRVRFGSREIMTARVTDEGVLVVDF
ncbi:flagellar basal body P-ring formation chaperone FlgA [Halovibrio sp. HP20-50]|uniref:flagellar basal body P-ring formation chaperone FlgA n=1 Tax=Halovibrio sp. HP20-59 TaxID=3080275 RepID=UPI00294B3DF3|nr:flagellar basal body P-ring formation chaperone FlgA [Halovibrio sp. HP20-59]MEA2120551.1 flagellar basal body P-ring formation chaperone FlgA [Halovibrio sp. HP20-59]